MKGILTTLILMAFLSAPAQNSLDTVLARIERNNTTLSALRKNSEAEMIANKTGIWPANPEIEFNYLWGNPSAIGNRTDFAVSQTFDFPTAYKFRNQISEYKNEQSRLEYQKQRREILNEARLLCGELTFQNALSAEYKKRVSHASQIAEAYRKMLDQGEANVLDYNKSRIYLLNMTKEYETIEIERSALQSGLTRLHGGIEIQFTDSVFNVPRVIAGFEEWVIQAEQNNPVLQWINQELAISQTARQLQVAQNLPKLSTGYMSEKVVGEQFQGITLGISIPLWENKNAIAYAEAKTMAVEELRKDAKLQFHNEIKTQHARLVELQASVDGYRNEISDYHHGDLIMKALDAGEISLGEYLYELSFYYDSVDKLLEMEHALYKAWVGLIMYN